MSTSSQVIEAAEHRAALASIDYNASNYQVLTLGIGLGLLLFMSSLAGTFVAVQAEDQNMNETVLSGIAVFEAVAIGIVFFCYIGYLRNIGHYIYSRIKPVFNPISNIPK